MYFGKIWCPQRNETKPYEMIIFIDQNQSYNDNQ